MDQKRYYVSASVAAWLKGERGLTDADLVGMSVTVDAGLPAGEAYAIVPKAVPQPAPIKWIALDRMVLRPTPLITTTVA